MPDAPPPSDFTGFLEDIFSALPNASEPLAIAETGFLSSKLSVYNFSLPPPCFPLLNSRRPRGHRTWDLHEPQPCPRVAASCA